MKRDFCVAVGAIAVWSGVFLLAEDAACGYAQVGIQWDTGPALSCGHYAAASHLPVSQKSASSCLLPVSS